MKIKKRLPPEEEKMRLYLYKKGLSDAKIGKICNVTGQAIWRWRKNRNLKARRTIYLSQEEERKRLELYWRGMNDIQIAKKCGVIVNTIWRWRRERKLSPYNKKTRTDSLCWYCQNGLANICPWIAQQKKVWSRAKEQKRINNTPYYNGKKPEYKIYIVIECPYFKLEEVRESAAV